MAFTVALFVLRCLKLCLASSIFLFFALPLSGLATEENSCARGLLHGGYPRLAETQAIVVDGREVKYTLILPPGFEGAVYRGPLTHYFHGALSDASQVNSSGLMKRFFRKITEENLEKVALLSISFGKFWMLDAPRSAPLKAKISTDETLRVLAAIHEKHSLEPQRLTAMGSSMGAYNLFQLALKSPDLYERIALLALPTLDGYAGYKDIAKKQRTIMRENFRELHDSAKSKVLSVVFSTGFSALIKRLYGSEEAWAANNPLNRLVNLETVPPGFPKVFLTTGSKDELGYFPANEKFARLALEKGFDIEWHPSEFKGHLGPYPVDELFSFLLAP